MAVNNTSKEDGITKGIDRVKKNMVHLGSSLGVAAACTMGL